MSSNIDKIIYINLNKRTDRREEIEGELNKFGLDYERFEGIETPGFGILGCGSSHLSVLKIAKERGYKNILILEDDFTFLVTKEEFEEELTKFFDSKIDYDVCMLAYGLLESEKTQHDFLTKIIKSQSASGYIVNEKYYDKMIDLYQWAMPLLADTKQHWIYANDQVWQRFQPDDNWYCFTKRIGKQRSGFSDTANKYFEYNC
jgi:glycosyl transferase family 25